MTGIVTPGIGIAKSLLAVRGVEAQASSSKPGLAPAGEVLCFCFAKRKYRYPKKRRAGFVGPLCGHTALLGPDGVDLKLAFDSDSRSP